MENSKEYQRRGGLVSRKRQSWKAGGAALNGQHPSRETRGQTWHIVPQLHPAVTGVDTGGGENGEGEYLSRENSER